MCSMMDSDYERKEVEVKLQEINSIKEKDDVKFSDTIDSINSDNASKEYVSQNTQDFVKFPTNIEENCYDNQDGLKDVIKEDLSEKYGQMWKVVKELLSDTDPETLTRFVDEGDGWNRCYVYLSELKSRLHHMTSKQTTEDIKFTADEKEMDELCACVEELLGLYARVNVSVDMLKSNSAAKHIKHFIKSHHHGISSLSKEIINKWMLTVSNNKGKDVKKNKNHQICNNNSDINKSPSNLNNNNTKSPHNTPENPLHCKNNHSSAPTTPTTTPPSPKIIPHSKESKGFMDALTSSISSNKPRKRATPPTRKSIFKSTLNNKINNNLAEEDYMGEHRENGAEDTSQEPTSLTHDEPSSKRSRKTVKFAEDLCSYFYFVVDESERVNVNKGMVDFVEGRRHEIEMEYQMFQNSRKQLFPAAVVDKQHWRQPMHITGVVALVEGGCNSVEKKVQLARQQQVLQVIYFSRDMVPDFAEEPDAEFQPITEPKAIPLSDITGVNSEVLYEHMTTKSTPTLPLLTKTSTTTNNLTTPEITHHPVFVPLDGELMNNVNNVAHTVNDVTLSVSSSSVTSSLSSPPPPHWSAMYPIMPPSPMMIPPVFMTPFHPPPPLFSQPFANQGNKPLCTHFMSGTCKFGNKCRNFHPLPYPNVINPPPINQLPPNHTFINQLSTKHQSPTNQSSINQSPINNNVDSINQPPHQTTNHTNQLTPKEGKDERMDTSTPKSPELNS